MTGRGEADQHRVNWAALQRVEDTCWMVLPMGANLADGYLGIGLFLAQLADLTGIDRYADVARHSVSALPQLLSVLAEQPALLAAVGCGGLEGLGGIGYGLARMAVLLGDAELRDWANPAVELAATAASLPSAAPGWTSGLAGCLAALGAIRDELGSAVADAAARACADRLTDLVEQTDGRCVAPTAAPGTAAPVGFAAGPAGIGWALTRFAARAGHARAGRLAAWRAGEPLLPMAGENSYGWCTGAAGLLLARTCLADDIGTDGLRATLRQLAERPVLSDLSLCHGELGITESLIALADVTKDSTAQRHRAGLILGSLNRHARYCGTPGGIQTPGLLNGLAGIGYGLLRLGFADRVPSVLLLEPGTRSRSR
jgi:lantibiotic modifying enzyme